MFPALLNDALFHLLNWKPFEACHNYSLRFDGTSFELEPESNYPHAGVNALGVYRNQPFVTGSDDPPNTKTEILDNESNQWMEGTDFPFSSGNR